MMMMLMATMARVKAAVATNSLCSPKNLPRRVSGGAGNGAELSC